MCKYTTFSVSVPLLRDIWVLCVYCRKAERWRKERSRGWPWLCGERREGNVERESKRVRGKSKGVKRVREEGASIPFL